MTRDEAPRILRLVAQPHERDLPEPLAKLEAEGMRAIARAFTTQALRLPDDSEERAEWLFISHRWAAAAQCRCPAPTRVGRAARERGRTRRG